MLEIFALINLCRVNGNNAGLRGRGSGWAKAYTVILWFSFEIGSMFLAVIGFAILDLEIGLGIYLFGLMGAGLGALTSWLIAKRGALAMTPMGNLRPDEIPYVQSSVPLTAPCQVVVVREKAFIETGAKTSILHNGEPVGQVGIGESFMFSTNTSHNVVTANDGLGMRLPTCVPFDAPDGGRVEITMKSGQFKVQQTRIFPGPGQPQPAGAPPRSAYPPR